MRKIWWRTFVEMLGLDEPGSTSWSPPSGPDPPPPPPSQNLMEMGSVVFNIPPDEKRDLLCGGYKHNKNTIEGSESAATQFMDTSVNVLVLTPPALRPWRAARRWSWWTTRFAVRLSRSAGPSPPPPPGTPPEPTSLSSSTAPSSFLVRLSAPRTPVSVQHTSSCFFIKCLCLYSSELLLLKHMNELLHTFYIWLILFFI